MNYPKSIENLISMLTKLPTVGPKTAERYVFYLLQQSGEDLQKFAQTIAELKEKTIVCKTCHAVSNSSPCEICSNQKRNRSTICIVASTRDLIAMENTKEYNGIYHVLGGNIDPIKGINPEQLNIRSLFKKIENNNIEEIIIALNPTMEGETTSMYLIKEIKKIKNIKRPEGIKISRLAKGLPSGFNIEYADELTLSSALKYRNKIE